MSKSPLTIYKEAAKSFGLTEDQLVPDVAKLSFVRTQEAEQKTIINRLLVDLTMSRIHQAEAKDDATKSAYEGKARGYENDIRQLVASLNVAQQLVEELESTVA